MDKGDTIDITKKWKNVMEELPKRFALTETEKNAVEFSVELYKKEIGQLIANKIYRGR